MILYIIKFLTSLNMNIMNILKLILLSLSLYGCVQTTYQKSFSVTKDVNGKIISTTTHESVIQPGRQGYPFSLQHIKNVEPFAKHNDKPL